MSQFTQYYTRFQGARGQWSGLPQWAQTMVGIAAIPGILLLFLSMLAFAVSLLALLLLSVPVYMLLRRLTGGGGSPVSVERVQDESSPGVKRVEATVVE